MTVEEAKKKKNLFIVLVICFSSIFCSLLSFFAYNLSRLKESKRIDSERTDLVNDNCYQSKEVKILEYAFNYDYVRLKVSDIDGTNEKVYGIYGNDSFVVLLEHELAEGDIITITFYIKKFQYGDSPIVGIKHLDKVYLNSNSGMRSLYDYVYSITRFSLGDNELILTLLFFWMATSGIGNLVFIILMTINITKYKEKLRNCKELTGMI